MNKKRIIAVMAVFLPVLTVSGVWYGNVSKQYKAASAVKAYNEFIGGKRSCEGEDIMTLATPDMEPARRYATDYFIVDSTGDGIPELHIRTTRAYTIFTYKGNDMVWLQSFYSHPTRFHLLENGAFIYREEPAADGIESECYDYFTVDSRGRREYKLSFEWENTNQNGIFDNNDTFYFNGDKCTMEEWFVKTEGYVRTDKIGATGICNEVEWIRYCEAVYSSDKSVQKLCELIRDFDFTAQEYPIDTEVYDAKTDRKYKEAFLAFIFDKTIYSVESLQYGDWTTFYYTLEGSMGLSSNEGYLEAMVKEAQYRYLDFDGDGMPELVVNRPKPETNPQRWGPRESQPLVLKYDPEKECVYIFLEGWQWLFRGSGELYYHKSEIGVEAYRLRKYGLSGSCTAEMIFHIYSDPPEAYYISYYNEEDADNIINLSGYVSKETWSEITGNFFDAIEHILPSMTFEDVFGDMAAPYMDEAEGRSGKGANAAQRYLGS